MEQRTNGKEKNAEQQALIVSIQLSCDLGTKQECARVFELEDEIMRQVEESGTGEYDGNEIGGGYFTLYMYGSSAARLWDLCLPILKNFHPPAGSYAIKRYGKPGARQDRIIVFE